MHIRSCLSIAAFILVIGSTGSMGQTPSQAGLDECRAKAISQGLVGDARNKAINDCIGSPVVVGASTPAGSRFSTCRSQARGQSLTGEAFNTALDQCMAQSGAAAEPGGKPTYQDC